MSTPSPTQLSDADLIATTGDPTDPRSSVELVLMRGRIIYDTTVDQRRF